MDTDIKSHNFAEYFNHYVGMVDSYDTPTEALEKTHIATNELMNLITEEKGNYAYEEGKWTIKELLSHIIDTERIFCNRALRFARNDKTDLPGYDHDNFVPYSGANDRRLSDILTEFNTVRTATISLFNSFNQEMLERSGTANGNRLTVLSIGFIIAGHEKHHIDVLESKYLS